MLVQFFCKRHRWRRHLCRDDLLNQLSKYETDWLICFCPKHSCTPEVPPPVTERTSCPKHHILGNMKGQFIVPCLVDGCCGLLARDEEKHWRNVVFSRRNNLPLVSLCLGSGEWGVFGVGLEFSVVPQAAKCFGLVPRERPSVWQWGGIPPAMGTAKG